jgi:4-amino-4-deoxy-L-arabinose transferase-like glycosyltransferase
MPRWKTIPFVLLLFTLSFGIRMAFVLALRDIHTGPQGISSADDVEFNNLALSVSQGQGYVNDRGQPTSFRAPGWPLFLAAIYRLTGPCVPLIYGILCLLGALACVLTYGLARELVAERPARIAGLLAAIYLPHLYFSAGFLSESLFVPCFTLGVWLFLRGWRQGSLALLILAGLALSWATLTRPFALLVWPILLALLASTPARRRRTRLLSMLAFSIAFFAFIVPWTLRNQLVHGRFVLIATNGGSTFYGGNNERVAHEFRQLGSWISTTELPARDWIDAAPTEVEHDKREWQLGWDWLRQHPGTLPLLGVYKVARLCLWLPDFDGGSRFYLVVRFLGYAPFLLLITIGVGVWVRRRDCWRADWLIVHGVMLATLVTAIIFWGSPRFRDANMPFLMIFAALGVTTLWRQQNVNEPQHSILTTQRNIYIASPCNASMAASAAAQTRDTHSATGVIPPTNS